MTRLGLWMMLALMAATNHLSGSRRVFLTDADLRLTRPTATTRRLT